MLNMSFFFFFCQCLSIIILAGSCYVDRAGLELTVILLTSQVPCLAGNAIFTDKGTEGSQGDSCCLVGLAVNGGTAGTLK